MRRITLATIFAALMLAVACNTTQPSLEGSKWSAREINGERVVLSEDDDPDSFSILFIGDLRIAAMGACNVIMGQYSSSEDGTIKIDHIGTTMMFCPNLELEERYVKALETTTRYSVKDDVLTLYEDRKAVVVFEKVLQVSQDEDHSHSH